MCCESYFNSFTEDKKLITYLDEADVLGVLPEALAAHVEPVFTDQTVSVRAYPAEIRKAEGLILISLHESVTYVQPSCMRKFTLAQSSFTMYVSIPANSNVKHILKFATA